MACIHTGMSSRFFVLNCVFDFCKNKKSAICVFERKMFMNKKSLAPAVATKLRRMLSFAKLSPQWSKGGIAKDGFDEKLCSRIVHL